MTSLTKRLIKLNKQAENAKSLIELARIEDLRIKLTRAEMVRRAHK